MSRERNVEAVARHTPLIDDRPNSLGVACLACSCGQWSNYGMLYGATDGPTWAEHLAAGGIGSPDALTDEDVEQVYERAVVATRYSKAMSYADNFRAALARAFGKERDDA